MVDFISNSKEETEVVAEHILGILNNLPKDRSGSFVVGLYGDLGAGKTTLTGMIAKKLGVKETVSSPTFVIMKSFSINKFGFKKLVHIDAYRLEDPKELENLGWQEIINDPENLVLIEWPERVSKIMPKHLKVDICHKGEDCRGVSIQML